MTAEAGKGPEKPNGKSSGIAAGATEVNSGSASDKTLMSSSSNSKDGCKEVIKEKSVFFFKTSEIPIKE